MNDLFIDNIKTPKQFGIALKRMRKHQGLSQSELALKINIRQPTISDVESGKGTMETVFKIIQALGINLILSSSDQIKKTSSGSPTKSAIDRIFG